MNEDFLRDKEIIGFFNSVFSVLANYKPVLKNTIFEESSFGTFTVIAEVNQNYIAYDLADDDEKLDVVLLKLRVPNGLNFKVEVIKKY